jgi:hypothetical protein
MSMVESLISENALEKQMGMLERANVMDAEGYAIYMHGAMCVSDADEETVRVRTKVWMEGRIVHSRWPHV